MACPPRCTLPARPSPSWPTCTRAAAIPSFVALEHHGLDLPFWEDLVTGLPDDYMAGGYVTVPDKPGLGVDLNYEGIEANLRFPGLFEPTDEWNTPKLGFWQPDRRWDK